MIAVVNGVVIVTAVGLGLYLTVALLKPEWFQ